MYLPLLKFKQVFRIMLVCMFAGITLSFITVNTFAQACGGRGGPPPKSSGTKFLLVFMSNEAAGYDQSVDRYQDIYLASNDPDNAITVTITCRAFPGWSKVINLPPHGSASFRVSTEPGIAFPAHDALIEVPEVVDSTVFKVVATAPITCYGMSNKQFTADAFLALPYDPSATEYRVMCYYNSNEQVIAMPSEFAVASFDNNDTVWITPAAVTSTGRPAGQEFFFVLDSGECVQIESDPTVFRGDLTGSVVRSKSPVVVYGGHVRTEAPEGFSYDLNGPTTTRDHLCEAMPPLSTWGTSFVAKNFGRADGDIVRILASKQNTVVRLNGKVWGKPFAENEFRDTLLAESIIPLENIATIESDNPILVGMIAHTADPSTHLGDPFLAIVPPLQQTYNDFTYFLSTDKTNYDSTQHFLIIVTEEHGIGKIVLDDTLTYLDTSYTKVPFPLLNGNHYAIATVNQRPGIHHITWKNAPSGKGNSFTILAYGWGNVISYGYTAGQLLVPLTGIIPLTSPTRSTAPSPGNPIPTIPSIIVRNILAEKIYFDSAQVFYSQNSQNVTVRLKKDIATETGTLPMGEEKILELAASPPVDDVVSGNIRVWYHTALWATLIPVDFPFVFVPQSVAGVSSEEFITVLENYPNPSAGRTTVHYAIPQAAYGSVKIYDALGRVVRIIWQGILSSGDQEIPVSTKGLIPGEYTLELVAPELGIGEHRKMIVMQ